MKLSQRTEQVSAKKPSDLVHKNCGLPSTMRKCYEVIYEMFHIKCYVDLAYSGGPQGKGT